MRAASFITKVGSTAAGREGGADVLIVHEPEIAATLRTRGRFYLLCEVAPPSRAGTEIAREVGEATRQEYYYDLSAGIEVALRRSLRKANRRAAQMLRDRRGHISLHLACALVVGNEAYAARVGRAQVFLMRHARLFLPGDEPGELADFVHRTTTRQAASLGAEADLLPVVWRQAVDAGDTLILASGGVLDGLGAEALKNAAVTLHPRAAADHVRNRFLAEGASGSDAVMFIEIARAPGAAARVAPETATPPEPEEVVIAESIRSKVDVVWRHRPRPARLLRTLLGPFGALGGKAVGVGLELLPRRPAELPRRPESARVRFARQQRLTTLLALVLLLASVAIGGVVLRDYEANRVLGDYRIAIISAEEDIRSARHLADRTPADVETAYQRLGHAAQTLDAAARSPAADLERIGKLRAEIGVLEDRLANVIIDLDAVAPGSQPRQITQTIHGLYVADPGSGRLWRLHGEPLIAAAVLQRGRGGVGSPMAVVAQGEALYSLDDARHLWRAEGAIVADATPKGVESWQATTDLAAFGGNIYVLDARSGQLWRHEPEPRAGLGTATAILPTVLPPGTARSVAVDGDAWVVMTSGEVFRYRRQGLATTLTRITFEMRWNGEPIRPTAIQARDDQRFIWLLDAPGQRVVQATRDGREIARFALPARLGEPSTFFVSEGLAMAFTAHGSKIAATDVGR